MSHSSVRLVTHFFFSISNVNESAFNLGERGSKWSRRTWWWVCVRECLLSGRLAKLKQMFSSTKNMYNFRSNGDNDMTLDDTGDAHWKCVSRDWNFNFKLARPARYSISNEKHKLTTLPRIIMRFSNYDEMNWNNLSWISLCVATSICRFANGGIFYLTICRTLKFNRK